MATSRQQNMIQLQHKSGRKDYVHKSYWDALTKSTKPQGGYYNGWRLADSSVEDSQTPEGVGNVPSQLKVSRGAQDATAVKGMSKLEQDAEVERRVNEIREKLEAQSVDYLAAVKKLESKLRKNFPEVYQNDELADPIDAAITILSQTQDAAKESPEVGQMNAIIDTLDKKKIEIPDGSSPTALVITIIEKLGKKGVAEILSAKK